MKLPVVGPTYETRARTFDGQRCVNLYLEISESGSSKSVARLVGTPGIRTFVDLTGGPIRGCITTSKAPQRCLFVSGQYVYEIDGDGLVTLRGSLNSQTGNVSLAENGTQVMIVDGVNGYIFTLATNLLTQITADAFPDGATVVQFMDTYFFVNDPDNGIVYFSGNYDGFSWSELDKFTVESSPDNVISLLADHGELIIAGPNSIEIYQNTGDSNRTFQRVGGAVLQVGIAAPFTLKSFDNTVVWVSEDVLEGGRFVYRLGNNNRAERISNVSVEKALASVSDISEAVIFVYRQEGHEFLVLQVPGLTATWVFDAATQMWHERTYYNSSTAQEEPHRAICYTNFANKSLVGDRESGKVYELLLDHYKDDGVNIHRTRITPHLSDELRYVSHNEVVLDMETGVGLIDGSAPQVMMRFSDDGGRTWGNERWASIGKIGEYKNRVRWTRCGIARDRVYLFKITDPVQVSINDAYVMLDGEQ